MTLDSIVEADILATCNALGSEINGEYEKGTDCIDCLKDILRYLKKDSENHGVLRYLGSVRLLQTDLLPILKKYHKDPEIFDFTLRILVSLTNPALLLYKEDLPDDKISRNEYLQIVSYLQSYKKAFFDVDSWKVLYEHLKDMLKMTPLERSTDENLVIERIIILVRNILHVPPDESVLKQTDDDTSVHDKVLWSLHLSKIDILLLYMTANEEEHQYCLHLLEIMFLMLREHTAEVLASSNEIRTETEKQKDLGALQAARQREQQLKLQKTQSVCKPRFSGVYCIKNLKSLSNNDMITYKYTSDVSDIHFDLHKNARLRPKRKARAPDVDNTRQSTLSIRVFLKNFCCESLKAYNKLMLSVKRELIRKLSDEHDETYYFWALRYFMQFNRLCDFQPALVSETVSTQTFHHIQTEITNFLEMMLTDKKKQMFWARRTHLGVGAYKELLETLKMMERSPDEGVKDCADALISHIFYVIEYRELLLSLMTHFDESKFPLSYLAELVESTQLFLKMLENHSKKHSEIIVQQKQKKNKRRRKKKTPNSEPVDEDTLLQQQWDAVVGELSEGVSNSEDIPTVTPFDAASGLAFEDQKIEVVFKIREAMIANKSLEAIGLLRAARDLWPEGDSFGATDIDHESEINVLKEIHFSNLKRTGEKNHPEPEEASDLDEEEEMEAALPSVSEKSLDLDEMYKKYASPKVIMPCSLLLANYRSNKPETNMCLVKLFHRIAWNCKMHALFFQSTIFLTFQKIFHDPDASFDPVIKELYRFARFIVQKFFAVAENNKKVFVEMLFWKGSREAYEVEEGYGTSELRNKAWNEDDDDELRYLYEENKDICIEGQDVADIILANINKKRKKTQIISSLKRLGLIKSVKDLKPEKRSEWLESEIIDLQHLFEENKDSDDAMSNILEKLSIKRSRKAVVDKLLELNLIQDRKEVRKKKSQRKKSQPGETEDSNSDDSSESSDNYQDEGNSDEDEINFFKNLKAERNQPANGSEQPSIFSGESSNSNTPPEIWDEQEIMELASIFNENSDSDDVLETIQNSLTVKRRKKEIIKKLLELALIKNEEQVCKKMAVKSNKIAKPKQSEDMDDKVQSDSDNNDDEIKDLKAKRKAKRRILSDNSSDDDADSSLLPQEANLIKNTPQSTKKKISRVWDEAEVMELTALFHSNAGSSNIMQDILKGLTIKRPKQAVTEKLLELRLIEDRKEVRKKRESKSKREGKESSDSEQTPKISTKKSKKQAVVDSSDEDVPLSEAVKTHNHSLQKAKNKKLPKVWDEQEIMEIHSLFNENQGSDDIVAAISNSLTVKRQRPAIVEKLIELGLIKDKKEVRKKRASKSKTENSFKDKMNSSVFQPSPELPIDDFSAEEESTDVIERKKNQRSRILSESSDDDYIVGDQETEHKEMALENVKTLSGKRKRIISSDESNDDNPTEAILDLENEANNSVALAVTKTKKRLCVIDDSDDSN